jgi:hypothetical protein
MAFDEYTAERITQVFKEKKIDFEASKMMGGLCYMVDGKMCCGIHNDKNTEASILMARVGEDFYEEALAIEGCELMTFTGRSMKGYVFVNADATDREEDLAFWIQKCIDFNPLAKASVKKKKKLK